MAVITYIKESEFDGKAQLYVDNDYLESSTFRVMKIFMLYNGMVNQVK